MNFFLHLPYFPIPYIYFIQGKGISYSSCLGSSSWLFHLLVVAFVSTAGQFATAWQSGVFSPHTVDSRPCSEVRGLRLRLHLHLHLLVKISALRGSSLVRGWQTDGGCQLIIAEGRGENGGPRGLRLANEFAQSCKSFDRRWLQQDFCSGFAFCWLLHSAGAFVCFAQIFGCCCHFDDVICKW